MDEARALALAGAPEGTMVQADMQSASRGRFGNRWTSMPGNLYVTFLLRPKAPVREVAQLSFAVAVALAEAVGRDDLRLKWPNDVLADGRKLAGILLEMESGAGEAAEFLLIGVGVNVTSAPEDRAWVNEGGMHMDADTLRDALFARLAHWYAVWQAEGFAPLRDAWLARAQGLHAPITARLAQESVAGVFEGIDDNGSLLLRQADGRLRAISSGEVHFADPLGKA